MPLPATLSSNIDFIAEILDNDCDPHSPYTLNLHCCSISFSWIRVKYGYFADDETVWIPGEYIVTNLQVNRE